MQSLKGWFQFSNLVSFNKTLFGVSCIDALPATTVWSWHGKVD